MATINVRDYRISNDGADDFPAFQRALAALESATPPDPDAVSGVTSGGILFIPTGHYNLSHPLVFKHPVLVQGSGLHAVTLTFQDLSLPADETIAGVVFEKGTLSDGTTANADRSVIPDLSIFGKGGSSLPSNPSPPADDQQEFPDGTSRSGIVLHTQAAIENCCIAGFQHDGIHINTHAGQNADAWWIQNCLIQQNRRHGLFVTGVDSGAGCAIGVVSSKNRRFGLYDQSQTGNAYIACSGEQNGFGGFRLGGAANAVALGCHSENPRDLIQFPAMAIGGSSPGSVGWTVIPGAVEPPVILSSLAADGTLAGVSVRATGVQPMNNSTLPPRLISGQFSVVLADAASGPLELTLPDFDPDPINGVMNRGFTVTVKKIDQSSNPVSFIFPSSARVDGRSPSDQPVTLTSPSAWVTFLWEVSLAPGTGT